MTVIDEKPVPLYVNECPECGSTFTYKNAEVSNVMLECPVCGTEQFASFQKFEDERKETK